jgi:hypothetical protein
VRKLLIIVFALLPLISFSQTEKIEKDYVNYLIQGGTLSTEEIKSLSTKFKSLLNEVGYPELPYDESEDKFVFKNIYDLPGIDANTIYDRCMEWIAIRFGSIASVLHYGDPNRGKIIVKGNTELTAHANYRSFFFGSKKERIELITCYFTMIYTIKDGKIKCEGENIEYEFTFISAAAISESTADYLETGNHSFTVPISTLFPIIAHDEIHWKKHISLAQATKRKLYNFGLSISEYIALDKADYDF